MKRCTMCEKEGFISHIIKGGKKIDSNRSESLPLSHINCQNLSYHTDETTNSQKSTFPEMRSPPSQHTKFLKTQNSQQQVSPTDEEIDCLLQKTGFFDEKGWSKFLGGSFMRASVFSFTVMCCLLAMLNGALVAGYVSSVITTIEKRFDIGSFYSGMVAASVEMGGAASVIFVSYFGSSRHIPGWIGLGAALTGFGALVFTLPHVMAPAYTVTGGLNSTSASESICRPKYPDLPRTSSLVSGFSLVDPLCDPKFSSPLFYVLILILAQLLIGIGGSPLYTLGTTYIDNHVSRMKAPSYIAFIYACGVFGPIAGFGLGALMLQYYVDLLTFDTTALNLSPINPKWVGAWWGGFVFIGALLLLVSVPFYGFPKILMSELKTLAKQDRQKFFSLMEVLNSSQGSQPLKPPMCLEATSSTMDCDSINREKLSYGKSIRDIPSALLKILKNAIYLVTSLGICCEVSVVSGFVFFLPKYLESEFGATKIMASLLTGGIAIPGAVIGILMGGHCLRHCQLTSKGAIQLTLALNSIALAGFGLFFVLGCDNVKIAGVTVPYDNHSHYNSLSSYVLLNHFNLSSTCNRHCSCDDNNLDLVCGADEVMFFSPCHAGCLDISSSNPTEQNYTNCSCARGYEPPDMANEGDEDDEQKRWVRSASGGSCQHVCGTLIPFMVMLFIMTFVIAGTQMPLLMVTIRSVGEQEKALALGLQFVMLRLFAYIPAPIIYGSQIDHTCIFWTKSCGSLGNCLVYDLVQLRYKFVGISFAYKFFAAMFYLSIWILMRMRPDKTLKDGDAITGKRMSLVVMEEPDLLRPPINFQSTGNDDAMESTMDDISFKKSADSSIADREVKSEDLSEQDNTIEMLFDVLEGEQVDEKKVFDGNSSDLMKHFDSFPLIDDETFEVKSGFEGNIVNKAT